MDYVLIDDDRITLFLTKKMLEFECHTRKVIDFDDPEKALTFLKQQILTGQMPNIILLDLNMPKISGWDLLDELEPFKEQLQAKCHIYLLTSSLDPADILRARDHPQVKELIHKPLNRYKIQKIQKDIIKVG